MPVVQTGDGGTRHLRLQRLVEVVCQFCGYRGCEGHGTMHGHLEVLDEVKKITAPPPRPVYIYYVSHRLPCTFLTLIHDVGI